VTNAPTPSEGPVNLWGPTGDFLFPVEPLYDLEVAAALIPMTYGALKTFLCRNKAEFLPRYRLKGRAHRRVRLLSATEIRRIRNVVIRHGSPLPFATQSSVTRR
jgi:hypothetical protein